MPKTRVYTSEKAGLIFQKLKSKNLGLYVPHAPDAVKGAIKQENPISLLWPNTLYLFDKCNPAVKIGSKDYSLAGIVLGEFFVGLYSAEGKQEKTYVSYQEFMDALEKMD